MASTIGALERAGVGVDDRARRGASSASSSSAPRRRAAHRGAGPLVDRVHGGRRGRPGLAAVSAAECGRAAHAGSRPPAAAAGSACHAATRARRRSSVRPLARGGGIVAGDEGSGSGCSHGDARRRRTSGGRGRWRRVSRVRRPAPGGGAAGGAVRQTSWRWSPSRSAAGTASGRAVRDPPAGPPGIVTEPPRRRRRRVTRRARSSSGQVGSATARRRRWRAGRYEDVPSPACTYGASTPIGRPRRTGVRRPERRYRWTA